MSYDDESEYFVSYNVYGGVDKRISRLDLMQAYIAFTHNGTLFRGVWEIRIGDYDVMRFDMRLAPQFEVDQHDNNWHSWPYSFMPSTL